MNGLGNTAEGEVIVNLEWTVTSEDECTRQAELDTRRPCGRAECGVFRRLRGYLCGRSTVGSGRRTGEAWSGDGEVRDGAGGAPLRWLAPRKGEERGTAYCEDHGAEGGAGRCCFCS